MQIAFEVMSVMAVMTNFALIALSPGVRGHFEKWGAVNSLLLFVAAEVSQFVVELQSSAINLINSSSNQNPQSLGPPNVTMGTEFGGPSKYRLVFSIQ